MFNRENIVLAKKVGKMLVAARKTVATAESCTAGLLSAVLTASAGASRYFFGGWIVYSNAMKTAELAVPEKLIRREGAVSAAVARKMAEGALAGAKSDFALAVTGIAGPGGGSSRKSIGTVWIALARRKGRGIETHAEKYLFRGNRALVRKKAVQTALNILRLHLI